MATLEITVEQIIELIQQLPIEDKQAVFEMLQKDFTHQKNPWLKIGGKYQNDPQFEEMLTYIERERLELD